MSAEADADKEDGVYSRQREFTKDRGGDYEGKHSAVSIPLSHSGYVRTKASKHIRIHNEGANLSLLTTCLPAQSYHRNEDRSAGLLQLWALLGHIYIHPFFLSKTSENGVKAKFVFREEKKKKKTQTCGVRIPKEALQFWKENFLSLGSTKSLEGFPLGW